PKPHKFFVADNILRTTEEDGEDTTSSRFRVELNRSATGVHDVAYQEKAQPAVDPLRTAGERLQDVGLPLRRQTLAVVGYAQFDTATLALRFDLHPEWAI